MNAELDKRKRLEALLSKDRQAQELRRAPAEDPLLQLPPLDWSPGDRHEPFPLTRIQQAYLIGRSRDFVLGNISTHNYFEFDLRHLDLERFEWAWNQLIRRHEMLRAVFSEQGTQSVLREVPPYRIPYTDLVDRSPTEAERILRETRDAMSHQIFQVQRWPLFDLRVVRKDQEGYRLYFSMDLLIADAMSTVIIFRELDRLYHDPAAALAPLTISFRSFVLASRQIEQSSAYEQAASYWRERVDTLPGPPELPLAKNPEAVESPRFKRRQFVLEAGRWGRCQRQARQIGITPSVLLATAFGMVLARWSKSSHFCVNLTLLNRLALHEQINLLVGDFTALVLLEMDIDGRESLQFNARRVQSQLWRDLNHRLFDGVEMLRLLNRRHGTQQSVSMPIVFTSALGLGGDNSQEGSDGLFFSLTRLSAEGNYGVTQSSQVWLDHTVRESEGALGVSWDALEELFPQGVLDDMFAAYTGMLRSVADAGSESSARLEFVLPPAQLAARRRANATERDPPGALLHEPFRLQARQQGERCAIKADWDLDYASLDRIAETVADRLHQVDQGQSELVAVVMTKGWEQIAAVFGVLYYGAGYVPIDAALPRERIQVLLEQAGVSVVITQPAQRSHLVLDEKYAVVTIDRGLLGEGKRPSITHRRRGLKDIAYVIYTSGSTGVPKGVVIEHQSAVNTVLDINRRLSVGPADRVLGLSSLSFDLSVYDIFGVLGAGGTLVLPEAEKERDPAHWLSLVAREEITLWNTVPPLAQLLVEQAEMNDESSRCLKSLRLALLSGDWIPPDLPDRLVRARPSMQVISLGGATEASIWSIFHPVMTPSSTLKSIPYGKPLENQSFHVLDEGLQDRPDWVTGHLYIGGMGLAREYWRDEEKTRASFVIHPQTGQRLYKTGDLGRYFPDGTIEFSGRSDSQVKIRGNRVELGEIESVLRGAEGIQDAAVVADGNKFGQKRLIAYIVPDYGAGNAAEVAGNTVRVLADPAARAAFLMAQHGLRRFADAAYPTVRLRANAQSLPPRVEFALADTIGPAAELGSEVSPPISLQRLGDWLNCLAQESGPGHAIPKRLYPSAGSTYAVQCYIYVKDRAVSDLAGGFYYFDPAECRLVQLNTVGGYSPLDRSGGAFAVYLAVDQQAIVPLYGQFADRYATLEAGHMQQLLAATGPLQRIETGALDIGGDSELTAGFRLSPGHRLVAALRGQGIAGDRVGPRVSMPRTARQSYRQFPGPHFDLASLQRLLARMPSVSFEVYVCATRSMQDRDRSRLLRLDPASRQLVEVEEVDSSVLSKMHGIENQAVQANAHFTLYLIKTPLDRATLLEAGGWTQQLMHLGIEQLIGFCPIGNVSRRPLQALRPQEEGLAYCLLGGAITAAQVAGQPSAGGASKSDVLQDLRGYLGRTLPDYMIPSTFVILDRLPLSTNGKVNRAALPAVKPAESSSVPAAAAPEGPVEEAIASLWCQVLELETVGAHDNFFEIGGDSLAAIRLLSLIRTRFQADSTEMSLRFLFEHPTVKQLAENIVLNDEVAWFEAAHAKILSSTTPLVEGEL